MSIKTRLNRFFSETPDILWPLFSFIAICAIVYAFYWVFKSGSYFFFYEGMVQDTIREMVKTGALK